MKRLRLTALLLSMTLAACGPSGSGNVVSEDRDVDADVVVHGDPPLQNIDVSGGADLSNG